MDIVNRIFGFCYPPETPSICNDFIYNKGVKEPNERWYKLWVPIKSDTFYFRYQGI